MRDDKLHAVAARSTFPSQSVRTISASGHFWKLRCSKSARGCGAKHVSKSKVQKMMGSDHFWRWRGDVEKADAVVARSTFSSQNVPKKSRSNFWKLRCRKSARGCGVKHMSKSKCTKHHMLGPLFNVQMSFCVAGARDCAPCQK